MNMKRMISILFTCTLAFSLAACSKTPQPVSSGESDPASASSAKPSFVEPKTYTYEEAAEINAAIDASTINLLQLISDFSAVASPEIIMATIRTSAGDIPVALFPSEAPKAVENFVTHAKNGYYNGMSFYKVINDFMIQTGAPEDKEPESIYKDETGKPVAFESEFSLNLWNFRGALTMVNKGALRPDTNTSEFMIIQAPFVDEETLADMEELNFPEEVISRYRSVGGIPGFDWHNTVFGMVTGDGLDVIDQIAASETDSANAPVDRIIIESVVIEE